MQRRFVAPAYTFEVILYDTKLFNLLEILYMFIDNIFRIWNIEFNNRLNNIEIFAINKILNINKLIK